MTNLQKETLELLKEGLSPTQVAKKLNRNISSISSIIKRFDVTNYTKLNENTCNHNYYEEIDNEIKAYTLGFFLADGYLCSKTNRLGVNIQNKDRIVLEYMNKYICPDNKIYVKNRTTESIERVDQCSLRWTSSLMKDTLMNKYKIINNKTYDTNFIFPFETIPNHLVRHFIRGFIDGDGHVGLINKNYISLRLLLISTSENFLKQIGEYICNITEGVNYSLKEKIGKTTKYYTIDFSVNRENKPEKFLKIYNYLYKNSELYLSRKKENFESYLKYRGKL